MIFHILSIDLPRQIQLGPGLQVQAKLSQELATMQLGLLTAAADGRTGVETPPRCLGEGRHGVHTYIYIYIYILLSSSSSSSSSIQYDIHIYIYIINTI